MTLKKRAIIFGIVLLTTGVGLVYDVWGVLFQELVSFDYGGVVTPIRWSAAIVLIVFGFVSLLVAKDTKS